MLDWPGSKVRVWAGQIAEGEAERTETRALLEASYNRMAFMEPRDFQRTVQRRYEEAESDTSRSGKPGRRQRRETSAREAIEQAEQIRRAFHEGRMRKLGPGEIDRLMEQH